MAVTVAVAAAVTVAVALVARRPPNPRNCLGVCVPCGVASFSPPSDRTVGLRTRSARKTERTRRPRLRSQRFPCGLGGGLQVRGQGPAVTSPTCHSSSRFEHVIHLQRRAIATMLAPPRFEQVIHLQIKLNHMRRAIATVFAPLRGARLEPTWLHIDVIQGLRTSRNVIHGIRTSRNVIHGICETVHYVRAPCT